LDVYDIPLLTDGFLPPILRLFVRWRKSVFLLFLYIFLPLLNSIFISLVLLLGKSEKARIMDLPFLCVIGIFFGITWFFIGRFDSLERVSK
jgi:hypothetical protein